MKFRLEDLDNLLTEGAWNYVVQSAIETTSKKTGKPQFELICNATDANGKTSQVKTWVPLWKLKEFCMSAGLEKEFNNLEVSERNCILAKGKCIGKTEKGTYFEGGKYPDKNSIVSFVEADAENADDARPISKEKIENTLGTGFIDDEIPF